jgi:hypothetical protein
MKNAPFQIGDRVRLKAPLLGRSYADIGRVTYVDETGHVTVNYAFYEVDPTRGYSPDQLELVSRAGDYKLDGGLVDDDPVVDVVEQAEECLRDWFDGLAHDVVETISSKILPTNPTRGLHLLAELVPALQALRKSVDAEPPADVAKGTQAHAITTMVSMFEKYFDQIILPKPGAPDPGFYELQTALATARDFEDFDAVARLEAAIKKKYTDLAPPVTDLAPPADGASTPSTEP